MMRMVGGLNYTTKQSFDNNYLGLYRERKNNTNNGQSDKEDILSSMNMMKKNNLNSSKGESLSNNVGFAEKIENSDLLEKKMNFENKLRQMELQNLRANIVYKNIASGNRPSDDELNLMMSKFPDLLNKAQEIRIKRMDIFERVENAKTKSEAESILNEASDDLFEVDSSHMAPLREKLRILIDFKEN